MKSLISIVFLYRGEGYPSVTVNVGASKAHKIVKIDYIALQCKSLKLKEELTIKINEGNGDGVNVESAHTKWSLP